MEKFDIGMLVMPSIALLTGLGLSIYFYRKQNNKKQYKKLIASVGAVAFLLNFTWEVAQGFLYKGYKYDWEHISFGTSESIWVFSGPFTFAKREFPLFVVLGHFNGIG